MDNPSKSPLSKAESTKLQKVHELLQQAESQPWIQPSADFADRVLSQLDRAPLVPEKQHSNGPHLWTGMAAAALLLLFAGIWLPATESDSPAETTLGQRVPPVASLQLDLPEQLLAREFDAMRKDALALLETLSTPLPR